MKQQSRDLLSSLRDGLLVNTRVLVGWFHLLLLIIIKAADFCEDELEDKSRVQWTVRACISLTVEFHLLNSFSIILTN